MAFGDAENDIPMLRAVRYGIAMENAAEHCKAAAFAVTGSNIEDGDARKIQESWGCKQGLACIAGNDYEEV